MGKLGTTLVGAVMMAALVGCGAGAGGGGGAGGRLEGGKQGAVGALFSTLAFQPSSSRSPLTAAAAFAGTSVENKSTVTGKSGGRVEISAAVEVDQSGSSSEVRIRETLKYVDFSNDGKTTLNGTLTNTLKVSASNSGGDVVYESDGRVDMSGDVDDVLEPKTSIRISARDGGGHRSGSVIINGSLKTGYDTYSFANESVAVAVDHIEATVSRVEKLLQQ